MTDETEAALYKDKYHRVCRERAEQAADNKRLRLALEQAQSVVDSLRTESELARSTLSMVIDNVESGSYESTGQAVDHAKNVMSGEEALAFDGLLQDALRFRWLLDGNGYFFEEEMLCGRAPSTDEEKTKARQAVDEAMKEQASRSGGSHA